MHLYRESYETIIYLKNQSDSFLAWICPLLKQLFIPLEQYIYYETDRVTEIYFLSTGTAGFVLPFKENIVYIEINNADTFGEIDLVMTSGDHLFSIEEMFENINKMKFNIVRLFTVQALENCTLLTISLKNIIRMQK
jgi:CRP-like cAMP-binding protein